MNTFKIGNKTYRAYPNRWFKDGVEITCTEYLSALRLLRSAT